MKRKVDPFLLLMVGAIGLASVVPAHGVVAHWLGPVDTLAIALLFFCHGAGMPRASVVAGIQQWRLHLVIFATTFVVFPLVVYPLQLLPTDLLPRELFLGFLYLAVLPSAVTSSIAFTAIARGNVPASVCSAAVSNVFGLMLTPVLTALLIHTTSAGSIDIAHSLREVAVKLLLPFALGQLAHPWLRNFTTHHRRLLENYDQGVIVLIIYTAFSQSVIDGLWNKLPPASLAVTLVLCTALLLAIMALMMLASRRFGFAREDEITAVFCGSKKSLASGLPMAEVLFAGAAGFGMLILPIMLYNQIQIMIGAVLAKRYAAGGVRRLDAALPRHV